MLNELQDGYLVLMENNYFEYYQTTWLVITMKEIIRTGRYTQTKDTLYLDWMGINPKTVKPYLSSKCVIDPGGENLWFVDEVSNKMLLQLNRKRLKN